MKEPHAFVLVSNHPCEKTVHLSLTLVLSSVALVLLIDESFALELHCTYCEQNKRNSMSGTFQSTTTSWAIKAAFPAQSFLDELRVAGIHV